MFLLAAVDEDRKKTVKFNVMLSRLKMKSKDKHHQTQTTNHLYSSIEPTKQPANNNNNNGVFCTLLTFMDFFLLLLYLFHLHLWKSLSKMPTKHRQQYADIVAKALKKKPFHCRYFNSNYRSCKWRNWKSNLIDVGVM